MFGWRGLANRRARKAMAPGGAGAHTVDPDAPAVTLHAARYPETASGSTAGVWSIAGKDYDVPQVACHATTGAGKNQTLLNPTAANILYHRDASLVVVDPKGDMLDEFWATTDDPTYVYSFMPEHEDTSALNLIETPKMAATTAAALYPVEGVKNPIFNQGARDLFESIADALGHAESDIVELYDVLRDQALLQTLAKRHPDVRAAVSGNKEFTGSVISSARLPLSALRRPEVARVFRGGGVDQPHFGDKEVVYICVPMDSEDVANLAGAVVDNLVNRATASRRGTYFLVDEAGSCLTISNMAKYLAMGRGLGANFFLVFQSVAQLTAKWGNEAKAKSMLGVLGLQFFGPTTDVSTAEYLSKLSGTVRVRRAVYEDEPGWIRTAKQVFSESGAEYRLEERDRAGILPEHVMDLPSGTWMVYSGSPHTVERVSVEPWWTYSHRVVPAEREDATLCGVPRPVGGEREDRERSYEREKRGAEASTEPLEDPLQAVQEEPPRNVAPDVRYCPSCGAAAGESGATFCSHCGSRM